jgi:hypothetical protein
LSAVFIFYPGRIAEAEIPFMQRTFLAVLQFVVEMTPTFAQVVEDKRPASISGSVVIEPKIESNVSALVIERGN